MPRLRLAGFEAPDEGRVRSLFETVAPAGWSLAGDEGDADAALIDLDSVYGQMAWMKGLPAGQVSIGLTRAARAGTDHRLEVPLDGDALAAVLGAIGVGSAYPDAPPDEGESADLPPTPAPPAAASAAQPALATQPAPVAETAPLSTHATRLAERIARASGPFAVQAEGLPRVVIDPQRQQFAPGKSLKALLPYAALDLPEAAISTLYPEEAETELRQAGDVQPLARLVWLLALGGGCGQVLGHPATARFQLGRWPQAEREFPKHFRIATVMLKAPATVAEIASAAGASEADVADYVNAALAAGHASAA